MKEPKGFEIYLRKDCEHNNTLKESGYHITHELYNTDNVSCRFYEEILSFFNLNIEKEMFNLKPKDVCSYCKHFSDLTIARIRNTEIVKSVLESCCCVVNFIAEINNRNKGNGK